MPKRMMILIVATMLAAAGCAELQDLGSQLPGGEPGQTEIASALRQALEVGTDHAVKLLSATDGYNGDELVRIAFPPQAQKAADALRGLGLGQLVDGFVTKMNRGAEAAASKAGPIFVSAIRQMTLSDARAILFGQDNAATQYFREKTSEQLYQAFYPQIRSALNSVQANTAWNELASRYNKIPLVQPINADITDYATTEALDGLFVKLQAQEKKIRENPGARSTALLKRVFGMLDG